MVRYRRSTYGKRDVDWLGLEGNLHVARDGSRRHLGLVVLPQQVQDGAFVARCRWQSLLLEHHLQRVIVQRCTLHSNQSLLR